MTVSIGEDTSGVRSLMLRVTWVLMSTCAAHRDCCSAAATSSAQARIAGGQPHFAAAQGVGLPQGGARRTRQHPQQRHLVRAKVNVAGQEDDVVISVRHALTEQPGRGVAWRRVSGGKASGGGSAGVWRQNRFPLRHRSRTTSGGLEKGKRRPRVLQ